MNKGRVGVIMASRFRSLSALALALVMTGAAHAATPSAPASSPGTAIAIMQASAALQAGNCADAMAPLNQLWNDPYLENSDPATAADFRLRLVACTAEKSGLQEALSLSADNITRPDSGLTAFDMHAFLQLMAKQPAAAADTLEAAMTRFPNHAGDLSDLTMLGALFQLHDANAPRELALLDHAEQAHWQTHVLAARQAMGLLRIEGLRSALAAGHDDIAALYRADIKTDAYSYMITQGDGGLSAADVPSDPVEPIITAQINEAKAAIVKMPNDLLTLGYLMTLERADGQNGIALTQLNGVLALVDQYGLQNFQNPEMYPELLGDRGQLLADTGRYAEALASFQAGAKKVDNMNNGDFYVSYAAYLVSRGDDKGAIALVDSLNVAGLSDAQKEALIASDACAFGRLGDPSYATFMHVIGDAPLRIRPHLCAGDTEGAAADLTASISSPVLRETAILMMQSTPDALAASDKDGQINTAINALKGRDDVTTAARATNIVVRSWPLRY